MTRRDRTPGARVRAAVAVCLATVAGLFACARPAPETSPNLLLVTFDALRQDHLSFLGYPRSTTPTLDGLAAGGVVHRDVVPTSCSTKASLTSLLTSLDCSSHRLLDHEAILDSEFETLAETLHDRGCDTVGSIGTPHVTRALGHL